MTVRASITHNEAWLGKEFGEAHARRLFGDAVVEALPRNTRGKNVGAHKAVLQFLKVASGGWAQGRVERRVGQIIGARIILRDFGTGKITVLHEQGETGSFAPS